MVVVEGVDGGGGGVGSLMREWLADNLQSRLIDNSITC